MALEIDERAARLNGVLQEQDPALLSLLSPFGQGLFYPKEGLLKQAEEAAKSRYNATVGIALEDEGAPMHYSALDTLLAGRAGRCVVYASSFGLPDLRTLWRKKILEKNLALAGEDGHISMPVVTSGITHGLSLALQMFLGPGESLILPDLYWPNYRLMVRHNCSAELRLYRTFNPEASGLDLRALRACLESPGEKKVCLLNFPNNPTGYSPSRREMQDLRALFLEAAEAGKSIAVLCDDAYWGLTYDPETEPQSLFAFLAGLHERILAVKCDGVTKEDFSWGLRVGFLTFGSKGLDAESAGVFEEKVGAGVRITVSNVSRLSQETLLDLFETGGIEAERSAYRDTLTRRWRKVREILDSGSEFRTCFTPLPYNSGYFLTLKLCAGLDAETVRLRLLERYGLGVIALQGCYLRLAFSAVAEEHLETVFSSVYRACLDLLEPS